MKYVYEAGCALFYEYKEQRSQIIICLHNALITFLAIIPVDVTSRAINWFDHANQLP